MDNFDFTKFYDHQPDYAAFRNDPEKRHEYDIAVNWKVKNLSSLVPDSIRFSNILEIGCAMGILLNKIADSLSIKERTGIDISIENIKTAQQFFNECTFIQGTIDDIESIMLKKKQGKKFDLVILSDIVEHIHDDLDFMKKVSNISSYILFNLPLEKCYMNRNRNYGVDDPSGHLRKYNKHDALKLVESADFEVIASCIANSHFDKDHFNIYRENRLNRIRKKKFLRKTFWSNYYYILDMIRVLAPWLYIKIFGSNYFALMKTTSK
jgi:SAM-dependent methyltransferase